MTTTAPRKKLIEVSIPLEAINTEARRRKQKAPKGYPTSIHKYWAQRPVAACRAVLFAQLVDDPSAWPDRYPTEEAQDIERRRLHRIIEDMVPWEASNNETVLTAARWEIARSVAWGLGEEPPGRGDGIAILDYLQTKAPPIYDPFSGGGTIPLEAQRLGLRTIGSDLNPVAVLIGKALIEIPPKFARIPPVNPSAQIEFGRGGQWNGTSCQGLVEDIRFYADLIRTEAEAAVGHLYPSVQIKDGSGGTVVAYMWARTVRSPDPSAGGAMVPLVSSFLLSTKEGKKVWVEPVLDVSEPDGYRFEVRDGLLGKENEARLKAGTKGQGRGSNFVCIHTGSTITGDYIKQEGMSGRLGTRMMAIVADGSRSRVYLSPVTAHEEAAKIAAADEKVIEARNGWLSQSVPERLTGGTCFPYGLTTFEKLYTDRQLLTLSTFASLISGVRSTIEEHARIAGLLEDSPTALSDGGIGTKAYAEAIATSLTLALGRMALYGSSLCRWLTKDNALGAAIPQKGLEMNWDFAEANFFADSSASFTMCAKNVSHCYLSQNYHQNDKSSVILVDAQTLNVKEPVIWNTDPPYYDNIAYADISDYFYPWHKRCLDSVWPDLYRRLSTNKQDELTALAYRTRRPAGIDDMTWINLDPRGKADLFFMEGIGHAFRQMNVGGDEAYPAIVYYAFRQQEETDEGTTSAGWAAVLQALIGAGFAIDGTWPLRTESTSALKANINALASSIVLVCRTRPTSATFVTRAEFVRALKRELPAAIDKIRKAGVGPVDMQQSVIGPGMGVFSRYSKILEDDDSTMTVRTALSIINRVWGEIENELDANFDPETQVALAWYADYGFDPRPSGDLITLANAKNISSDALFASDVFVNMRGKAALTSREALPRGWTPACDKSLTVWECVQHTARVLNAENGGGAAAGRLVAEMGPKATEARALAYRLFEIATQKGWAAEALIYNELAQEWPKLEDLASSAEVRAITTTAQAELF
ncbi:DUF1156 domain-containing protein [Rhizobium binxianense]|uniref:DUF1156 domain-containing protein n=1 Tax=Rhizobium binxianense TaxID=3024242 RepID=UPI0023A9E32D|nr:DUF1156 domain-containing protein [Rhizobium sp. MJ22]WEA26402.1 DUF1156 domain-containing protein [Rhizobium sp. MJ22]